MKSFIEKLGDALRTFSPIILLLFVCSCYLIRPVKKPIPDEEWVELQKKIVVANQLKNHWELNPVNFWQQ